MHSNNQYLSFSLYRLPLRLPMQHCTIENIAANSMTAVAAQVIARNLVPFVAAIPI